MVFTLSGHMKAEEIAGLKALYATAYQSIVLDLRDVRLADRDADAHRSGDGRTRDGNGLRRPEGEPDRAFGSRVAGRIQVVVATPR